MAAGSTRDVELIVVVKAVDGEGGPHGGERRDGMEVFASCEGSHGEAELTTVVARAKERGGASKRKP